jgi:hypothetical protein
MPENQHHTILCTQYVGDILTFKCAPPDGAHQNRNDDAGCPTHQGIANA